MVANSLRWAYFALPTPARKAVRAARQRVATPKARDLSLSEQELTRFAEVIFRLGMMR